MQSERKTVMDEQDLGATTRTTFTAHERSPANDRARTMKIGLAVCLLAVVGLAYALYDTYDTGQGWQRQARQAEDDLEAALVANSGLQENLTSSDADLDESEADVARLEERLRELADVQAQTADSRNRMVVEVSTWQEITQAVAETTTELDTCIDLMVGLHDLQVSSWNLAMLGRWVDVDAVNRAADETFALCNNVRDRAWVMRTLVLDQ